MESQIKMQTEQFSKPLYIINGICLTMSIWFTYKHYFYNDGKGIDNVFYMLSMLTLPSCFGLIAVTKLSHAKVYKNWLIISNIFIVLAVVFVEKELIKGVFYIAIIPFITYLLPQFSKNRKTIINAMTVSFIYAFITSILPIFSFMMSLISIIIGIINPA
ncbi:hypothetical protein ACFE6N_18790 [Pedobacter sp. BG31]|uniref:hypothetical protein n=1 Tax=Pedobacter sp. BG31 TaxID=3349697 RepID=UPI0035F30756